MQITARKQRFSPINIKYAAAALGIVGALSAGVVTYTVTRDDSQASQSVAAPPIQAYFEEMAGENTLGGSPAVPAPVSLERDRPALREGFQANGPGDDFASPSPKARGVPSVTTREDITAYTPFGAGEGFIAGNESADLSYVAPEVRSYADIVFLEKNWATDVTQESRSSAGMLDEEYTQPNPGAAR